MAHEFKVGDRVRRIIDDCDVPKGTLGTVLKVDPVDCEGECTVWCKFDNGENYYGALSSCIEPAAPPPAEPPSRSAPPLVEVNWQAMANELSGRLDECRRQLSEALRAKGTVSDVLGDRDRYRRENHELATRNAWLERENARLAGKKGSR